MARATRKAEVVWRGDLAAGEGSFTVGSGAVPEQPVTWASRAGDPAGKTSPEELIAAAHASCYAMALSNTIADAGREPEELQVTAECTFDVDAVRISTSALRVVGRVPGVDAGEFERLAREGERACPVSNALRGNVDISVSAVLAE
jgi:osmotically inducible protein OsmC